MTIADIFSKRQKIRRGDVPDVYKYDLIPDPLRVQIVMIYIEGLGDEGEVQWQSGPQQAYAFIVKTLCKEYGSFQLPGVRATQNGPFYELRQFVLTQPDHEKVLDAVELCFRLIDTFTRSHQYLNRSNPDERADNAIEELNARFKEHGIGYQFTDGMIIRVDSQLIHSEVVKPALQLLNQKHFSGAQEEFLKAHEHYRAGNAKESLNESLKAFESLMKGICKKRNWTVDKNASAKTLINVCLSNGLIPPYWQQSFMSLSSLLESSVPTGRNKLSGHGQGADPVTVPDYLVAYMLHMTASAIVFLAEADGKLL